VASISATADPTTGTVLVTVEQTTLRDLFTRVVANGWGNATTGQAWTSAGGVVGNYSVSGTQGVHAVTATNSARQTFVTPFATPDHGFFAQVTVPVAALTQAIQVGVMARWVDANNFYIAEITLATSGVVTLNLNRHAGGVRTTLATFTVNEVHAAGATWNIGIEACGTTLRGKAWRSTVTEPGWQVTAADPTIMTATQVGARSFAVTGNTNVPFNTSWDNAFAYVSQPIRVFRNIGGALEELRGSPGFTENPTAAADTATAVYWDNESPFDVSMVYELRSNCSQTLIASSGAVTLVSNDNGWLRDPTDPTKNILITMEDFYDECIDQDVVVFSGLGERLYENAAGIFDHVDARRPITVSQLRKNYASTLFLTSFSLDDVDALEDIFDPNSVLSLSLPLAYGWAHRNFGTDYITIFDITQSLLGVDQTITARVWTCPFRLSDAPGDTSELGTGGNGIGGGGATYDDLAASVIGTTYNSLTAAGFSYFQIASGTGY
jgi:hypothetical protein